MQFVISTQSFLNAVGVWLLLSWWILIEIDIFFHKSNASTFYVSLNLYSMLKSRDNKGQYSQGYGLPRGHVWVWELDRKECRTPNNWCLQTAVLEKARRSHHSILREINTDTCWNNWCWSWSSSILVIRCEQLTESLMLGMTEGTRRRGHQRVRWLDGITSGHELGQTSGDGGRDREAWHAAVYGVAKNRTWLGNWTTTALSNYLLRWF